MALKKRRDWSKPLTKRELYSTLDDCRKVPIKVLEDVANLDYLHKSPCSLSFYSRKKDWNYTEPETLRFSDHWNYKSNYTGDKIHSKTNISVPNNTWVKAIYDVETDIFIVQEIYDNRRSTKAQIKALKEKIFPSNPFKPLPEAINTLKQFSEDVRSGKVFYKLNGSLKKVERITRSEMRLEGDILFDRIKTIGCKSTYSNFTIKYPDFCIVYNDKEYTEVELYQNNFLHGKQTTQED